MRILMHCVYYAPEVGGLESHIEYLCRGLVARGHEVDVVTSRSRPGLPRHEVMDGVRVWRTWMPARNTVGWATHALASLPRFGDLAGEADVLHAQDIAAVVDKVKDATGSVIKPRGQLQPADVNPMQAVSAQDIGVVVNAVKGSAYPLVQLEACP